MKIENSKYYRVRKYGKVDSDLGTMNGEDVKGLLKGYAYDEDYDMWFSKASTIGYDVQEVK